MDRDKLFNSILTYEDKNDDDELGMILSNNTDMGNSQGALISVKQFSALTKDIKRWRANKKSCPLYIDYKKGCQAIKDHELMQQGIDPRSKHSNQTA